MRESKFSILLRHFWFVAYSKLLLLILHLFLYLYVTLLLILLVPGAMTLNGGWVLNSDLEGDRDLIWGTVPTIFSEGIK